MLNNYRIIFEAGEEENLLSELPEDLKTSIMIKAFGKVVERITFLSENEQKSQEFVWATISLAKERKYVQNEVIYQKDDVGDSFYMIYEGVVTLQAPNEIPIITYRASNLVGDSEAYLEKQSRDCKAYASQNPTILYQIMMKDME